MSKIREGDSVKIHYVCKLEDGSVFDSSKTKGTPLQFSIGAGQVIKGLEDALLGMKRGETKTVSISSEDGYGDYDYNKVLVVKRTPELEQANPSVGQVLQMRNPDSGEVIQVTVTHQGEENITLDGNHPLSGKNLIFEVEVVKIIKPSKQ